MSEMVEQLDLFSYQKQYTITKPIFLIEAFGGIGAQRKGLEILGVPLSKNHILIEWSKESVKAYARIHNMIDDEKIEEICKGKTKEEMLDRIKGISRDYETPMSDKQLNRLSIKEIKDIYACCIATNNLIDVSKVKGRDLGEFSKDEEVIFTYSFPCQSLSLAGLKEGMEKDSGTTSSLLWEIERILRERERELYVYNDYP